MKKRLVGLCVLGSLSSFGGTLINESSNQYINFEMKSVDGKEILSINGAEAGLSNKEGELGELSELFQAELKNKLDSKSPAFFFSKNTLENDRGSYTLVVSGAIDLAALPVTAPTSLALVKNYNKDLKIVDEVITNNKTAYVSNRRFQRISDAFSLSKVGKFTTIVMPELDGNLFSYKSDANAVCQKLGFSLAVKDSLKKTDKNTRQGFNYHGGQPQSKFIVKKNGEVVGPVLKHWWIQEIACIK